MRTSLKLEKGAELLSAPDRLEAGDRCSDCPLPSGPAPTQPILHKETHKGPFSPRFPCSHWGDPVTSSLSQAKQPVRLCPRVPGRGAVMWALLSYSVDLPLRTAVSAPRRTWRSSWGRAPEAGRSGYWWGVWALSFSCVSSMSALLSCGI